MKKMKNIIDGWQNVLTNLGKLNKDKRTGMEAVTNYLSQQTVDAIYQTDDMCAKIIDLIPKDMTREGFQIVTEDNKDISNKIQMYFESLGLDKKIEKALKWARLYGGAGIILGIQDGKEPSEPVDFKNIKSIDYLTVLDRYRLMPDGGSENIDRNVMSENFGKPVFYKLQNSNIELGEKTFVKIHHSRVLRFEGIELGHDQMVYVDYWGDSVLSRLYNVLRNYQGSHDSAAVILTDFTQMVVKLKNLADMIASGDDDLVIKRLNLMSATASIVNAIVIEDGEDIERKTTNVAGLPQMLEKINERLIAASGYPHTILLGEGAAGGLGTQGQSEKRDYYDSIKNIQESELRPIIRSLCDLLFISKSGPTNGKKPEYTIEFNPLWQPTLKETVETRKLQAETDEKYINTGVLDPAEVTSSRFGNNGYSHETQIDLETRKQTEFNPAVENEDD